MIMTEIRDKSVWAVGPPLCQSMPGAMADWKRASTSGSPERVTGVY